METKTVQYEGQSIEVPVKPWYYSKQIWIGVITAAIGIFSFVDANAGLSISLIATGILQIILRTLTVTAIK